MPPHRDTRDGPVVKAAIKALETKNLNYVLIWIPEDSAKELKGIFEKTLRARKAEKMRRKLPMTGSSRIPSGSTGPARGQRIPA